MSARDDIAAHFTSGTLADELLDAHAAQVLAEDRTEPLVVSRFDVAMEPAPEEESVLTIGAVAEDGRPVALLLDEETRRKVAGWLAPGGDGGAELKRLRAFAWATDRRHDEIRARLAMVDIRDSADAWDLGMAIIAVLDGPLDLDSETAPRLADFEAVRYSHRGQYRAVDEYRCRKCGAIGGQGTETKTLADLIGMALRHQCLPRVEGASDGAPARATDHEGESQ